MKFLSKTIQATWYIKSFGLFKVPLIFYCRPTVVKLTEKTTIIKIPLGAGTKIILNLCILVLWPLEQTVAGGVLVLDLIRKSGSDISLIFKDFKADFLKRPEGDTHFICNDGLAVKNLIEEAAKTGERINMVLNITATVPKISGNEPVAEFALTVSLKDKSK